MSIALNKYALICEAHAISKGIISPDSSSTPLLYDISRNWRELLEATNFKYRDESQWTEKEEAASKVIVSALTYLQHLGCRNIEKLLKDTIERLSQRCE